MKRTALFESHQKLGAKLIEFGGWEMAVQYTSITREHLAVRTAAGMFDISHMGEIYLDGPAAESFLNYVLTNDARALAVGQGQYTLLCNEHGGTVDDLYAYRLASSEYLLIVNASRIPNDFDWLQQQWAVFPNAQQVRLRNASETTGALAVQGPRVAQFIDSVFPGPSLAGTVAARVSELKKNQIARFRFGKAEVWISRTGYTGEDGVEIVAPNDVIVSAWNRLLEAGGQHGLIPAGLGARDTLRTEMCYPLYGQELDEQTSPIEAGLGFFVALEKEDFLGRSILAEQRAGTLNRKLTAFKMTERSAPPRPHYTIWAAGSEGAKLGQVTSGTQSPSLNLGIGLGYVPPEFAAAGTALEIEIRGKRADAQVVRKPIYRKPS